MRTIAHIWDDYLSDSFVEVHPFLKRKTGYRSINIAKTLWDNGKQHDNATFALETGHIDDLLNPSLFRRLQGAVNRRFRPGKYHHFCRSLLSREKVDLIHAHFGFTAAQIVPVLRDSGLPSLVTFYGSDASAGVRSSFWQAKYKEMFPHLGGILVLCDAVKKRLMELGCPGGKIAVWNLPAGVEDYPYHPRKKSSTVEFVMAARFIEKKGYPTILEAFRITRKELPNVKLTLIGYGSDKEMIAELIKAKGLSESTRLIDTKMSGNFTKLYNEELKDKHIFVLPSTTAKNGDDEGGPSLTLVYAQAAGLPVITTHFPGSEITVKENESGHYFHDNDPEDLAVKMITLANQPESWNKLGEAGSFLANQEFSENSQMRKLLTFYDNLIESGKLTK